MLPPGDHVNIDSANTLPRFWPLLFPATYLLHIAEEYWCGERFFNWASRVTGINLTEQAFLEINAAALTIMLLMSAMAYSRPTFQWIVIPMSTAVSLNGVAHLLGTIFSRSYSPGLVTGVLLWIPLGAFTLYRARGTGRYWAGVILGIILHGLVTLVALMSR
jgi:hypothetical protein